MVLCRALLNDGRNLWQMVSVKRGRAPLTPGSALNAAATIGRSEASVTQALTKRAAFTATAGSLCSDSCFF